jgi:hypothetical protein
VVVGHPAVQDQQRSPATNVLIVDRSIAKVRDRHRRDDMTTLAPPTLTHSIQRRLESRTESIGLVTASIEHLIAWDLWIDPNVVSELESLGADLSLADQILNDRGWGDSWVRYVEEQGFDAVIGTRPTGVTELDRAWATFLATPEGSDEEFVAIWDYNLRLLAMLLKQSERITFE